MSYPVLSLEQFHALPVDQGTPRRLILGARGWFLPSPRLGGEWVRVVLSSGGAGDYAAYVGVGADARWVVDHGNKVPFEVARLAFPGLEEARYRP